MVKSIEKDQLKILFCAYDKPGQIASGPNSWIQRLIPELVIKFDLNIHVLFIHSGEQINCPTISFFNKINEVPVFSIKKAEVPYISDQVKLILELIRDNSFTVLVANCVIPAYYSARFLKPYNIPVIGVLHSYDAFHQGLIKKFIKGRLEDRIDACVSVSDYINSLAFFNSSILNYQVIPCGIPVSDKLVSKKPNEVLNIIYAGRIVIEAKQILKLAEAFLSASSKNLNLNFSIYGDGPESEGLIELLDQYKYSHKVKFFGSIPPSEIQDRMATHHVFTLMSDYEGMPIALMEAMSLGVVPVVLKGPKGFEEIIKNGVNGFIVENRYSDYLEKLSLLNSDPILWQTLSKNARLKISQKYTDEITNKKWVDLFKTYKNTSFKEVKIPRRVKLYGDILASGDNRKPSYLQIYKYNLDQSWIIFKLFLRPRARIKSIFRIKTKHNNLPS